MTNEATMKVLSLVPGRHKTFYKNQIAGLEQLGVDVTTITPRKQGFKYLGNEDLSRNIFDYVPLYGNTLKSSFDDYDVIHANSGTTAPFAVAQPHRPIVLSLWGSDLMGKYGWVSKYCARLHDEVIVMSEPMKKELDTEAHIIPHGVNLNHFRPLSQEDAQETVGWDPTRKHVLFLYDPQRPVKNYPLAKRVVTRVGANFDEDVKLQVPFPVDQEAVPLYLNAADALLVTSHREGSPNTVKEALACNIPIVSTDVGDVRDRLSTVELSFVCDGEDELVEHLEYVLEQGTRSDGREHVLDVSLEEMSERVLDVYEQAVSGGD